MKNPFKKEDNSSALAGIAIGAMVAGAITYLYLKKQAAAKAAAQEIKEHATDYLKPKPLKKKQTTDVHELEKIVGVDA